MYIKRHAEETIKKLSKMFGAVLVTGARQVGKTTLLKEMMDEMRYVTLDDPILLTSAITQGGTFFKENKPPIFIDEIQYAPNLFNYIKIDIDESKEKGRYFLSGSQQFHMMKNITESLAGRIGILNLLGMSLRERQKDTFTESFLPTEIFLQKRKDTATEVGYDEIWEIIHRGSMPELVLNDDYDWQLFYSAYLRTYIERDVRDLTQVGDEVKFIQFMVAMASRTGQLLNITSVSKEVGISVPTAERWLSILQTSNIIYLLRPYSNNIIKRSVKTPKVYFLDTGLAAYLTRWNNSEVLKVGAMAGAFFETFVITEIIKSYTNKGVEAPVYFYRDKDGKEIDLLIDDNGSLYPIEIKKHADPSKKDITAFSILDKISDKKRGEGGVVCMYDKIVALSDTDRTIPLWYV